MPTLKIGKLEIHTEDLDTGTFELVEDWLATKRQITEIKMELSIVDDAQHFYTNVLFSSINKRKK